MWLQRIAVPQLSPTIGKAIIPRHLIQRNFDDSVFLQVETEGLSSFYPSDACVERTDMKPSKPVFDILRGWVLRLYLAKIRALS